MPNMYAYIHESNKKVDPLGLADIWYRALHPNDIKSLDSGGNIIVKDPNARQTPTNHVNFGSEKWYPGDQYISITRNPELAEKWAKDSGTEIVEIDLSKSRSDFLDLSTEEGRNTHTFKDKGAKYKDKIRAGRFAEMMEEGLVLGRIEKEAIIKRYKPTCG